jgi:hypothetical protein
MELVFGFVAGRGRRHPGIRARFFGGMRQDICLASTLVAA